MVMVFELMNQFTAQSGFAVKQQAGGFVDWRLGLKDTGKLVPVGKIVVRKRQFIDATAANDILVMGKRSCAQHASARIDQIKKRPEGYHLSRAKLSD